MPQNVYITLGLPGSGKTTWAEEKVEQLCAQNRSCFRINNDDIRDCLRPKFTNESGVHVWTPKFEKEVGRVRTEQIRFALKNGMDVILDNTNLNHKSLMKVLRFIDQEFPERFIEFKDFRSVPLETCIERDNERKRKGERFVGPEVIIQMWSEYILPKIPKKENVPGLKFAILCDLDGTLALLNGRNAYDASNCDQTDTPNPHVLDLINTYRIYRNDVQVIFLSGRSEDDREPTLRFLRKTCLFYEDLMLFMRPSKDQRHDEIVKKELYEQHIKDKYNVLFVVDDRPKVIRMWKSLGFDVFNVGHSVEF